MVKPKTIIYFADIEPLKDKDVFDKLYNQVSDSRKSKIDAYKLEKDKCLSLGVECLFMNACVDFDIDYKNIKLYTNAQGKPYFEKLNIFFNLSHSGSKVMCIMSNNECGCDIEKIEEDSTVLDVAKRFYSDDEYNVVKKSSDVSNTFYKLWTLKESYTKCVGKGINLPLNTFSVLNKEIISNGNRYYLYSDIQDGYSLSWCLEDNENGRNIYLDQIKYKRVKL